MNALPLPRRVATVLLEAAVAIAPEGALEWGHAMLSELRHVEGNWAALFWSLGGAGVLAKRALVAFLFPAANRSGFPSGGDLFSKEAPMRKATLGITAACVVASLLFFLAPVFRQAFRISLMQWSHVIHVRSALDEPRRADPVLESVARKAEQNRDAEALAFVAVRMPYPYRSEGARLAEEAVRLDPSLTWLYGVVATPYPHKPEFDHWISDLEKFDPENALPHLMAAQKIGIKFTLNKQFPKGHEEENPGWREEMAAAFQSPKLDTYFDRQKQLDRRVIARYGIDDPLVVIDEDDHFRLPSYAAWYSDRYAQSLLESGEKLQAQDDSKAAFANYWTVAKFGQLLERENPFVFYESFRDAVAHLEAVSRRDGNAAQADFYSALNSQAEERRRQAIASLRGRNWEPSVSQWNAIVARAAGAAMLFFGSLLAICLVAVLVRGRSLRLSAFRPSAGTLAVACTSAVVALFSSGMLYLTYRPYSEIFHRFVANGSDAALPQLSDFLSSALLPLGAGRNRYLDFYGVVFYFWVGVAVLCGLALLLAVLRHLQTRHRATATA